jgi:hypothetical protein
MEQTTMGVLKKPLETHDIQGILLSGYLHLPYSNYLFLHVNDAAQAKAWLARIIRLRLVTSAKYPIGPDGKPAKPPWAINIAFTAQGIEALGYSASTFTQEFQEGIAYKSKDDEQTKRGIAQSVWAIPTPTARRTGNWVASRLRQSRCSMSA